MILQTLAMVGNINKILINNSSITQGGLTSLVILVPRHYNGLPQLQKKILNLGSMDTIFDKLRLRNVVVTIPKFKFKKMLNLNKALQQVKFGSHERPLHMF
jgi:serine protease inhibitor